MSDKLYVLFGRRKIRLVPSVQWQRLIILRMLQLRIIQLLSKNDKP